LCLGKGYSPLEGQPPYDRGNCRKIEEISKQQEAANRVPKILKQSAQIAGAPITPPKSAKLFDVFR